MATEPKTVAYIVDQASLADDVLAKSMFGDYGTYCRGRMIGLVRDDKLFVKADGVRARPCIGCGGGAALFCG